MLTTLFLCNKENHTTWNCKYQMSIKELVDPFTGESVKRNKNKIQISLW